jgi:hypothetical protein
MGAMNRLCNPITGEPRKIRRGQSDSAVSVPAALSCSGLLPLWYQERDGLTGYNAIMQWQEETHSYKSILSVLAFISSAFRGK